MSDNTKRLEMLIISHKGKCPLCGHGHLVYRIPKADKYPRKFLGCSNFPKCLWTSYKEAL